MFLGILSQDLPEATDRDVDELLQMIEDIQNQRLPPAQGKKDQDEQALRGSV